MQIMTEGAQKAQMMIDNLLDYSRIGRADRDFDYIDLNIIVNGVLSTLDLEIEEKNADIELDALPTITGNEGLLARLFQNMIENALKYQKEDQAPHIKIYAKTKDGFHHIHIEDNGIGINPKFEEKIFLMFQRLHGDESEYQGQGIGLSICQRIARAHNGNLKLDKDYTNGAAFILSLPIS